MSILGVFTSISLTNVKLHPFNISQTHRRRHILKGSVIHFVAHGFLKESLF